MTHAQPKRTFESALPTLSGMAKAQPAKLPALEEVTPAKYARLNPKQRRELLSRLIDYLKTF
jgi:hypothetical protein